MGKANVSSHDQVSGASICDPVQDLFVGAGGSHGSQPNTEEHKPRRWESLDLDAMV